MAHAIEPAAIPESGTVDNQRIALPSADGIAHPSRIWIVRQWTTIKKDLPKYGVLLVKDDHEMRRLDDFVRQWNRAGSWDARRLALRTRAEFPVGFEALFKQRHCPRSHWNVIGIEVRHDVYEIARGHNIFDAFRLSLGIGLRRA